MDPKILARALIILFILFVLFITCQFSRADSVILQWDPNEPIPQGYRLYQRLDGADYDYTMPIYEGGNTTVEVDNLDPGYQYYFVVRAFVGKNDSGDSNELGFLPDLQPPKNLRIRLEIGVYIDINGQPIITTSALKQ